MHIEEALTYHLENDAGVSALVGDRIYPNVIPQDVQLPAIAYQVITRPEIMAHDGPVGLAWPRFQITAQADLYIEILNVIDQVRDAVIGFTGLMGGAGGVTIEGVFVYDYHDIWSFETGRETRRIDLVIGHQTGS